jgi:lambda family phage portal protein
MLNRILKRLEVFKGRPLSVRLQSPASLLPGIGRSARHPFSFARLLGRYDAAVTTPDNARHWMAADGLSANAANRPEIRRILRNRARYEVANNSYARGIVLTLANDVIGTGPRLQMLTDSSEANRRIEQEFMAWSKAVRLPEKLRTMRTARATDGEAFALLTNNPVLPTQIQLDLRLIEADQVTSVELGSIFENAVDGIEFDQFGNPKRYHILRGHPGEGQFRFPHQHDSVPASSVLHWYRMDRPGQARGIPDIMPALPLFAQLRRYTLAVLASAETAADFAGILYTDAPAGGEADAAEPFEPIELEKRALLTMPGGWRMEQMRSEQPSTSYGEFKHELLNEIARCLNMPYNVASANSSGYNYASGRLDHQTYYKAIRVEQSHLECAVLDRLLAAWFDEAALLPDFLPAGLGPIASWPHQWFWDGHEHVDPAKEANAQATRLASHTTTLADEYARRGQDWETQLRQRAKELSLMNQLGLVTSQSTPMEDPEDADDVDEEEATRAK